jgi:hypothetical protein
MEPGRESQTAGHLPSMLRLPGSQGQASLIDEISLALHVLDAADLRLLASGLRVPISVPPCTGHCQLVPRHRSKYGANMVTFIRSGGGYGR